jgi:hypothetical protein
VPTLDRMAATMRCAFSPSSRRGASTEASIPRATC